MSLFHYSFENLPFQDVVEASREHLSRIALLDVEPLKGDQLLSVGMDVRLLPGLTVGRLWCAPGRAWRSAAHAADGNDNVMLVMPVDTEMSISRRGQADLVCRPGEAFVWACDEPASFTFLEHCTTLNISLPRALLAGCLSNIDARLMTTIDGAAMQDLWLLRGYVRMLIAGEPLQPGTEHMVVAHLQDLVTLLLGSADEQGGAKSGKGVRAARLRAIQADVAANIARPLPAEEMAARHGISPRHLRSLFAEAGTTFTDFVLAQRLARAKRLLADPRLADRSVAAIAYSCGFNDLSYFGRVFRRRYGCSPSEARAG